MRVIWRIVAKIWGMTKGVDRVLPCGTIETERQVMQEVNTKINPLVKCGVPDLARVYHNLFSEGYWKNLKLDVALNLYDFPEQVVEAMITMLDQEAVASVSFVEQDGVFYKGTEGPYPDSGIDFPALDTELNEDMTLRVIPTYSYCKETHEVTVRYHTRLVFGRVTVDEIEAVLFVVYAPSFFKNLWREIPRLKDMVRCWWRREEVNFANQD